MAKTTKPVRLSEEVMSEAERQAALEHRSVPKQLEYWLRLGKLVAQNIRAEDSLALMQGFLQLRVEPSDPGDFDMDDVLADLAADRDSGELANRVTGSDFRYGIDPDDPHRLVRVDRTGKQRLENGDTT